MFYNPIPGRTMWLMVDIGSLPADRLSELAFFFGGVGLDDPTERIEIQATLVCTYSSVIMPREWHGSGMGKWSMPLPDLRRTLALVRGHGFGRAREESGWRIARSRRQPRALDLFEANVPVLIEDQEAGYTTTMHHAWNGRDDAVARRCGANSGVESVAGVTRERSRVTARLGKSSEVKKKQDTTPCVEAERGAREVDEDGRIDAGKKRSRTRAGEMMKDAREGESQDGVVGVGVGEVKVYQEEVDGKLDEHTAHARIES
ncbi:uncharacterized protein BXZ73DRAFT_76582 [Epithele typhae]|uniref:uncharacterized protein n=1 Tax=Epithele typhae TaxID=378194 RepID=UPI0020076239|nr:uncharacterized protein BXZ73DRAFT_76582 [Epithele typhae]KAH9936760.1 hypothetical protein BXZ73DRAFT_76582 [Epithele typhae]